MCLGWKMLENAGRSGIMLEMLKTTENAGSTWKITEI